MNEGWLLIVGCWALVVKYFTIAHCQLLIAHCLLLMVKFHRFGLLILLIITYKKAHINNPA